MKPFPRLLVTLFLIAGAGGPQWAPPAARAGEAALPKTRINPKDGAELVLIPAGEYVAANLHLKTPVRRTLPAYYLYRKPVTIAQYERFCVGTERKLPRQPDWTKAAGDSLIPQRWTRGITEAPVSGVTWEDAVAYCRWAGVSLPTDGQWEKAAWGTIGPDTVPESPFGILDLRVVIHQWCEFNPEDRSSMLLQGPKAAGLHSIRGAYGPFDPQPWEHSALQDGKFGNGFRSALNLP
jgi:hypothetical protein